MDRSNWIGLGILGLIVSAAVSANVTDRSNRSRPETTTTNTTTTTTGPLYDTATSSPPIASYETSLAIPPRSELSLHTPPSTSGLGLDYAAPRSSGLSPYTYEPRDEFDEGSARRRAERDLSLDTYRGASRAYGCTIDCSGHEAGWEYQAQRGYGAGYGGNSRSFQQGRQAFDEAVDERVDEMRQEFEQEQESDSAYDY